MKNLVLMVAVSLAVAACEKPEGPGEAQRFELVSNSPMASREEKCAQATKTRDAFLRDGNRKEYETWQLLANVWCGT